jgi:hypothetical protein
MTPGETRRGGVVDSPKKIGSLSDPQDAAGLEMTQISEFKPVMFDRGFVAISPRKEAPATALDSRNPAAVAPKRPAKVKET